MRLSIISDYITNLLLLHRFQVTISYW